MAYINGQPLARYYGVGPQFTHYCPSGFLQEGSNELILFETLYPRANQSVSFMSAHLHVAPHKTDDAPLRNGGDEPHVDRS